MGDIRNRAGNREQAIADYTTALDSVGNESWLEREILAQLEQVFRREDDIAGLKKLYDDLVAKYPKRIAVRRRQAQLLAEQGDPEPAIAAFREVMKLTPGGIKIYTHMELSASHDEIPNGEIIIVSRDSKPAYVGNNWFYSIFIGGSGIYKAKFEDLDHAILFAETLAGVRVCGTCKWWERIKHSHVGTCLKDSTIIERTQRDGCIRWKGKEG